MYFEKHSIWRKNCFGYFWSNFENNWATFHSNILSQFKSVNVDSKY